ncbi:hypothetical protein HK104_011256 [Borealophlyctis nickersoniae]|nr:hypothetical protein HK104_011256 [Borealophlyctis nickersoniae]
MLTTQFSSALALCLGLVTTGITAAPRTVVHISVPAPSGAKAETVAETATAAAVARKRGLAWPWNGLKEDFVNFSGNLPHVTWLYNWEPYKPDGLPTNLEYVGMCRTAANVGTLSDRLKESKPKILLGFNEPDLAGGDGQMSVGTAVSLWRQHIQPTGLRLGSPAPSNGPNGLTWLDQFMSQCTNCNVDFVAIHWYGLSLDDFKKHITDAYNIAKKYKGDNVKVWLTEFASQTQDAAEERKFFDAAVAWLDQQSFVERYAWFGAMRGNVVSPGAAMMAPGGGLTDLGKAYL